ncbi:MAG: pyroglutamyl-peptidase I [Tissierellia bacterium]|nr:pyroglutamyl-peptidase I [Tissierellia bacterium]
MKILITAFDPFGGEKTNPSWEAIKDLNIKDVHKLMLPTSFEKAKTLLIDKIDELKPDVVLSIGQAGGRSKISIEQVGINLMDAKIPDNDGYMPKQIRIVEDGADAYFSTLDTYEMSDYLNSKDIPAYVSLSAGAYVCNSVLYSALEYAKKNNLNYQAAFVHVPYISEQVLDKPSNTPFMELELIKKGIRALIEYLNV